MANDILPETAINMLPLSAEPLLHWKGKTDIRRFIDAVYGLPFSSEVYRREKKGVWTWSKWFLKCAREASREERPVFLEDENFGKASKYVVAWKCCIQTLLEEAGFYSLAHILEADEEVGCSLLLASHFYYKQAVQVLRNFVEETLLPINFCENVHEFNLWKASNYRTPPLRGRDGLVKKLVDRGILSDALGNVITDLYGDLNGYIHGSENKLIHKGVHSGVHDGLIFKATDFYAWCQYLSRSIDLGIRLLRINCVQWEHIKSLKRESLRSQGKVLCDTCHNEEDFDISIFPPEDVDCEVEVFAPDGTSFKADRFFPGVITHTYRCRHCGSKTIFIPNPLPPSYHLEVTINSEIVDFEDLGF